MRQKPFTFDDELFKPEIRFWCFEGPGDSGEDAGDNGGEPGGGSEDAGDADDGNSGDGGENESSFFGGLITGPDITRGPVTRVSDTFEESIIFAKDKTSGPVSNADRDPAETFLENNAGAVKGALKSVAGGPIVALANIGIGAFFDRAQSFKGNETVAAISAPFEAVDKAVSDAVGPEVTTALDIASWAGAGFVAGGPLGAAIGFGLGLLAQPDKNMQIAQPVNAQPAVNVDLPPPDLKIDDGDWPPKGPA